MPNNMMKYPLAQAIGQYLRTTTFHGFKYLYPAHSADRLGWLIIFWASFSISGLLCVTLYSRFIQVPNLLTLTSFDGRGAMPLVALCTPTDVLVHSVVNNLLEGNLTLVKPLSRAIRGKNTPESEMDYIQDMLKIQGVSITEALIRYTPNCLDIASRCRVNDFMVDCPKIVYQDLTPFGPCCAIGATRFNRNEKFYSSMKKIEVVWNYTRDDIFTGYDYIIRNHGSNWMKSSSLTPGYVYYLTMKFHTVRGGQSEQLADGECESDRYYSRIRCFEDCAEKACRCLDPLQSFYYADLDRNLPTCPLKKIRCLREHKSVSDHDCHCPIQCKKIKTYSAMEFTNMNALKYNIDPLYVGLNDSSSIVTYIRMRNYGSRVFTRMPTETWFTLLSSLGGVFNMFLGVGLFSVLEVVFLLLLRLPAVYKRSRELNVPYH